MHTQLGNYALHLIPTHPAGSSGAKGNQSSDPPPKFRAKPMALAFKVTPMPNIVALLIYVQVPNPHSCVFFRVEAMGIQKNSTYLHKCEPLAFINPLELVSSSTSYRTSIECTLSFVGHWFRIPGCPLGQRTSLLFCGHRIGFTVP